jgi:predicted glycosyltransferase
MRLWIDLANSPHVPFFNALKKEFLRLGHEVEFTARDFAETVALAEQAGLSAEVIGEFGGGKIAGKAGNLAQRAFALARWARSRRFDRALSHNSYSQILAARALRITTVTLMDYEYQPANHLAFRLSNKIIVPACFPLNQLNNYGARAGKVLRYDGTKEDVYLADFQPDAQFSSQLSALGVASDDILVLLRPPAHDALYHRFENSLFDEALAVLLAKPRVKVVLLPRDSIQRSHYGEHSYPNLIIPESPLPGSDLIAASDLVISAGGTINREAAALGVPAASIYSGKWAAVDQTFVEEGRLQRITSKEDLERLIIEKKSTANARRAKNVRSEVVKLILD